MIAGRLVPDDFDVPERLDGDGFHLRMLTVHDLVADYDAVMTSVERLRGSMSPTSDWPVGLTLTDDLIDLGWHQREFTRRRSFAYTVMAPDESVCLGCAYLYPSDRERYDAICFYWVRSSEADSGLDGRLGAALRAWLAARWPFHAVAFPGRDVPWDRW